jgi:hypothetical protein
MAVAAALMHLATCHVEILSRVFLTLPAAPTSIQDVPRGVVREHPAAVTRQLTLLLTQPDQALVLMPRQMRLQLAASGGTGRGSCAQPCLGR